MEIFSRALAEHAETFAAQGFVHVPDAVSAKFLDAAAAFLDAPHPTRLPPPGVGGQKSHTLFEFPAEVDYMESFVLPVAKLCGLDSARFTLSQRHIVRYDADANEMPKVHKDRYSSCVSIGIPLHVPESSVLTLYPYDDVQDNHFLTTDLRRSLPVRELPEARCAGWRQVEIAERPGDLVVFRGSRMWHTRRNPCRALHLYLMVNDILLDPLGQDPWATLNRQRGRVLFDLDEGDRGIAVLIQGRQFDTLSNHVHRNGAVTRTASVWPDSTVFLTEQEERLVQRLGAGESLAGLDELGQECGFADRDEVEGAVRRLLDEGVLDLC